MASRRAEVDAKRQGGLVELVRATQDYEDEESVLAGTDDLAAILESRWDASPSPPCSAPAHSVPFCSEMDLYGRLEELEGAKTPAEIMDLAIVHTELACMPLTPKVQGLLFFFLVL